VHSGYEVRHANRRSPLSANSRVLEASVQPYVKSPSDVLIFVLDQHRGTRDILVTEGRGLAHGFAVFLTCEFGVVHPKCGNVHSKRAFSATEFL
jgi:hypothetical protein